MQPQPPARSQTRTRAVRKAHHVIPDPVSLADEKDLLIRVWALKKRTETGWEIGSVHDEIDRIFREDEDKSAAAAREHERLIVETWARPFGTRALVDVNSSSGIHEVARIRDQAERYLWLVGAPAQVKWRVYVNAVPQHAAEVAVHIAELIRSAPLQAGIKMGSYPILATGRDSIACYVRTDEDLAAMLADLRGWLLKNESFVSRRCVRFSTRLDKGLSYTMDPPVGLPWVDLALAWEESDAGKEWRAQNPDRQLRHEGAQFSFSELIVEILFSCLLRASSPIEFTDLFTQEVMVNAGLDGTTGEMKLLPAIVGCLTNRLYERTSPSGS